MSRSALRTSVAQWRLGVGTTPRLLTIDGGYLQGRGGDATVRIAGTVSDRLVVNWPAFPGGRVSLTGTQGPLALDTPMSFSSPPVFAGASLGSTRISRSSILISPIRHSASLRCCIETPSRSPA